MRFLGKAPRSQLQNSTQRNIKHLDLVKVCQEKQTKIANRKGNISRDSFHLGDKVRLQDQRSRKWNLLGSIQEEREANDGKKVSYVIALDSGGTTIRHKSHMRHFTAVSERATDVKVNFADTVTFSDGNTAALRDKGESTHTRLSKLKLRRQRKRNSYPAPSATAQY